jgi:hypothetical protein
MENFSAWIRWRRWLVSLILTRFITLQFSRHSRSTTHLNSSAPNNVTRFTRVITRLTSADPMGTTVSRTVPTVQRSFDFSRWINAARLHSFLKTPAKLLADQRRPPAKSNHRRSSLFFIRWKFTSRDKTERIFVRLKPDQISTKLNEIWTQDSLPMCD